MIGRISPVIVTGCTEPAFTAPHRRPIDSLILICAGAGGGEFSSLFRSVDCFVIFDFAASKELLFSSCSSKSWPEVFSDWWISFRESCDRPPEVLHGDTCEDPTDSSCAFSWEGSCFPLISRSLYIESIETEDGSPCWQFCLFSSGKREQQVLPLDFWICDVVFNNYSSVLYCIYLFNLCLLQTGILPFIKLWTPAHLSLKISLHYSLNNNDLKPHEIIMILNSLQTLCVS